MDSISSKEREIVIDINRILDTSREVGNPALADENIGSVSINMCGNVDENSVNLKTGATVPLGVGKNGKREKGKPKSVKKSPKPPRPPQSLLSLDAADQKLIREIAALANIKRAKIERMKNMRAAKASSSSSTSSSSGGNLIALLFTLILFGVILLQGCQFSHGNKPSNSDGVPLTSIESDPKMMQPLSRYMKQRKI